MQFDVVNSESKKIGEMDLKEEIFNTKLKPYLWHEIVKWQLAKKRQGTAKTKERNEVSGTTKKMYRQKGTGRARHGSAKSPIFVGGGQTFGPIPRSYDYNIPKKMKKVALSSALSMKQKRKLLKIVDALPMKGIKTKNALAMLKPFDFATALVVDVDNLNLAKSVHNLRQYKFIKPEGINVYDLMKFSGLIITKSAISKVEEALSL
jgi:large subunit ribosomal protein L4